MLNLCSLYQSVLIKLFITLSLTFYATKVQADGIYITGQTRANITYELIPFVSVLVMDKDSVILASGMSDDNDGSNPCQFSIEGIPFRESYILKFSRIGYETTFIPLTLKRRQTSVEMGNVIMKPFYELLDEVLITATKIKMVLDKDTIIYNADAFQMSEGSMLDNLVRQMSGVELNDAGQITVNGRYVSSLLLNGNDFFEGDPKIALENLPAFMIDKVKVYEKKRGDAYLMRNEADMDKDLVMDVNLKKRYSIGFIANAEAGYGSSDSYVGRLFGLRFTDHSRLSFYVNANNLNQKQKPGRSGEWNNQWVQAGRTDMKTGGLDLMINDKKGVYQLNSSLILQLEEIDNQRLSSGIAFLTDYDRYTFARNNSKNKNTSLSTNHELTIKKPYLWSKFNLSASYSHLNNMGLLQGAEFKEKLVEAYKGEVLDSLFSPNQYISFASALINSHQEMNKSKADNYNAKFYGYVSLRDFKFVANAIYDNRTTKEFSQYELNSSNGTTDFRNRYIDMFSKRFSYDIMAQYYYSLPDHDNFGMAISYTYAGKYESGDKALYRLDEYNDWNSFKGYPLGYLPSTRDSLFQVMDMQNSYYSKEETRVHTPSLSFSYRFPTDDQAFISLTLPLDIEHNKLNYQRAVLDTVVSRNLVLFKPTFEYARSHYGEKSRNRQEFNYTFNQSAPALVKMLDIRDDSNPLFIQLSNPDLRHEKSHKINFSHTHNRQDKQRTLGLNVDWELLVDAIGQSMSYNEINGVRTYIPKNVNGNWTVGGSFNFSQAIDKNKHWQISTATGVRHINSVDWISLTGIENSIKSKVKNLNITEILKLDYRKGDLHIGANVRGKWTHAASKRDNFNTINSIDLNYGVLAVLALPLKFKLSTDLTLYTRRGYSYETMNTKEVVWNATLSRSFLHGNMTFAVDGFDILGQLSNIQQTLNTQGRTETWFNSIPQYVMVRMAYRLNREPKK